MEPSRAQGAIEGGDTAPNFLPRMFSLEFSPAVPHRRIFSLSSRCFRHVDARTRIEIEIEIEIEEESKRGGDGGRRPSVVSQVPTRHPLGRSTLKLLLPTASSLSPYKGDKPW